MTTSLWVVYFWGVALAFVTWARFTYQRPPGDTFEFGHIPGQSKAWALAVAGIYCWLWPFFAALGILCYAWRGLCWLTDKVVGA